MEENNDNEDRVSSIHDALKEIYSKIRESYHRDTDETKYMIKFIKMLKEMSTHNTLEEYFSNNEELLSYFMGNFLSEVIKYILIQKTIIGENGDDIALDLLLHIFKLFLKFHKNEKYSPLFEKIRTIFKYDNNYISFYTSHKFNDDEDEKKYDYSYFNEQFCSEFKKKLEKKGFKVDDEVDFLVEKNIGKNEFEKKFWARGKIKEIRDDQYVIQYFDDEEKIISVNDFNIFEKNSKAKDWDWRSNLKKWDVIDCFDRNKWYPATITDVKDACLNNLGIFNREHLSLNFITKLGIWFTPQERKELEEYDPVTGKGKDRLQVIKERHNLKSNIRLQTKQSGLTYAELRSMLNLRTKKYSELSTDQLVLLRNKVLFCFIEELEKHIAQWEERVAQIKKVCEIRGITLNYDKK